jgi:4-amino-4-deoxy-L-arabinose transferase-like glycosyltransferase
LLDWHSWRQVDTASVTREYVKHGISPLVPRYHDLSNIPSGLENPEGYRMVEFPALNILTAAIIKAAPDLPLVQTSRMVSILLSLGTLISLFFFVKELFGLKTAYLSAFWFAFLPYSIYYSRTVLPEPAMLFAATFSLTTFTYWLKSKHWGWYLTSLLSLALALLLKPFAIFLFPVYGALVFNKFRWQFWRQWSLYLFGALALGPLFAWREWIPQYPAGIPASDWLFNSNGIRLRPAWFRWLFYERVTKLFLGYAGLLLVVGSPFFLTRAQLRIFLAWWAGILSYLILIATGNVHHDYYQVMLTAPMSLTLALGSLVIYRQLAKVINPLVAIVSLVIISSLTLGIAWTQVSGYFNVNHWEYVRAGQAADRLLPEDAKVIAPAYGGDTGFLFQTNRSGWPIGFDIDNKIKQGATHYLTTNYDEEAKDLAEKYFIVEQTEEYLLLDLTSTRESNQ